MAVKPINELAPRTPSATDVLAVADPFNGQTGKSSVAQVLGAFTQLSAKTPLNTDLVPVADPVTGIAGKSTVESVKYLKTFQDATSALTISPPISDPYVEFLNSTTTLSISSLDPFGPINGVLPFQATNIPNSCVNYSLSEWPGSGDVRSSTTGVSIAGQLGSRVNLYFQNMSNLQTFSAPDTKAVNISFVNCYKIQTISIPNAERIEMGFQNQPTGRFISQLSSSTATFVSINWQFISSVMTSFSFPECVRSGNLSLRAASNTYGFPNLTTFNLPKLKYAATIILTGAPLLTNISLPELEVCANLSLNISYAQTISLPKLRNIYDGGLITSYSALTSISVPLLKRTGTSLVSNSSSAVSLPALTSIDCPSYEGWGNIIYSSNNNDVTVPLTPNNLDGYWQFGISSAPNLTTINLPMLDFASGSGNISFNITGCPNLSTFTIKQTPKLYNGNFICTGAALNQASVDGILVALAYMNGTANAPYQAYSNKTVNLSGGTSATPSATGLAAKATLVARGCTVTHN